MVVVFANEWVARIPMAALVAVMIMVSIGTFNWASLRAEVRLFVLGRRGESAETTHRDLGRNLERMVRALNRPILAVTDDFREPQRVIFVTCRCMW